MKKIINFLKTLLYGIIPAIAGGAIVMDVYYIIKNIKYITTGSGWIVVSYFILGLVELFLAITLLHALGSINILAKQNSGNIQNNTAKSVDNTTSDSLENETSDMTVTD